MSKNKKQNEQIIMEGVPREKEESFDVEEKVEQITLDQVSEGQISVFDDSFKDSMIDSSVAEKRLKEAIEGEKPGKKRKSFITNLIFLIINVGVFGFIINSCLNEADGVPLKQIISTQGNKLWWLTLGVLLFIVFYFADTMIFYCLLKQSTKKSRFITAYKVSTIGKYFDSITPFSVAGEPAQILTLTRAGLSPGIATSIPIIKLIIYDITYTIIILAFLIFAVPFIPISSSLNGLLFTLFKIVAYIGVIFTALSSLVFILTGNGKIVGRSMVRWIVRLGYKLRIVKNYRKAYNKVMGQVLEYQSSMKYLKNNKAILFKCIFFSVLEVFAYFSIPFAVVMAFSPTDIVGFSNIISILIICITNFIVCQMAAVVIPLPGGTGMMEFSFIALFGVSSLIGGSNIVWGLLVWRFLTYYFTLLQGFIVSTTDSIVRIVRAKKNGDGLIKSQKKIEEP